MKILLVWTNVTKTNVAWTNVTLIYDIWYICPQKPTFKILVKIGSVTAEILLIWTSVAWINAAWTNVTMTAVIGLRLSRKANL